MTTQVDLKQLAVRRDRTGSPEPARRRRWLSRYLLPGAVLLGFVGLAGWAARDSLLPARPVTVVPVLTSRAEIQTAGTPLFQAAGWVEPRPTPTLVTALAEGVVEQLLVVEGQEIKAGQVVARLVEADARLALDATVADRQLREAELAASRATLAAARTNLAQPVQLEAAVAETEAALAKTQTELERVPSQLKAAEARQRLARLEWEGKTNVAGSLPPLSVHKARSELDMAMAAVEELERQQTSLAKEVAALTRHRDALRKRLELKTEEAKQLAEAEAGLKAAEARLRQTQVAEETARLRLDRMTVRSPVAGRVLALAARPGVRLMGLATGAHQESSTVVTLYDPQSLQIRADVRLEDVPRVVGGQRVRVETSAVPGGPLDGEVLFATSQADVQKNTLQVKVAVESPPPVLKPDMLVQVTFLAPPRPTGKQEGNEPLRLLIPRSLVDAEGRVWLADQAAGVARRRAVKLGATAGELVEVVEGLTAADKLIAGGAEGLEDGGRIRVTAEDAGLGVASKPSGGGKVHH